MDSLLPDNYGAGVPDRIADACDDRSARGIAAAVSRLINAGELAPGERLPTVRVLARHLGVSPTTVSEAWQVLGDAGAISARGRQGTVVIGPPTPFAPRRFRRVTEAPGHFPLDLSTGTPDPDLLPDLSSVLSRVSRRSLTTSYLDDPVLPALGEVLRESWPFVPEALTVVDGAMDALDRLATALVRLGDRVVVENPTFPPLLDRLELLGADLIGVGVDDEGIVSAELAAALARGPVALFCQPRAHNPLGVSTTPERAGELAALLRGTGTVVVEDDHAAGIAIAPAVSLGTALPAQTILIRSFSKSHGPDLRLAAVGGAGEPILRMAQRRLLGAGWSSRLLQAVLAELLTDASCVAAVATARDTYADRRRAVTSALADRGVGLEGDDGINAWLPVADERSAQLGLAARGIGAAPGTPFLVSPLDVDHLRLTVGLVPVDRAEALADQVAAAVGTTGRSARVHPR
jgi:DNA-binding transcriptional MocR family regulator